MDCSLPGSSVHGISWARILEWVAIPLSNECVCMYIYIYIYITLVLYILWNGLPFPSPGDLPDPGIKPGSPALQADAFTV